MPLFEQTSRVTLSEGLATMLRAKSFCIILAPWQATLPCFRSSVKK